MRTREPRNKPKRAFRSKKKHAPPETQENLKQATDDKRPRGNSKNIDPVEAVFADIAQNKAYLEQLFSRSSDIVMRVVQIAQGPEVLVVFVDGLVDSSHIDDALIKPLVYKIGHMSALDQVRPTDAKAFLEQFLAIGQAQLSDTLTEAIDRMMTGDTLLLVDGCEQAILLSSRKWEHRPPSEPETEAVVRGPREGFVESLRTNTALLRRRVRTPHFVIESMRIGRVTKTDVAFCYIDGIISQDVVQEVRNRLKSIDTDGIIDSGYIEEFIEDHPFSPFPTIQETERPDTATGCLLEGRCVILVDGSPFALIAPINLWGALQASEDYYQRFLFSTLLRWLRFVFLIIALTLPSLYIAITTFHQEMLPTNLLLSIAASREASPFPALIEALAMEITFEALREAGVRLPKTVGQAVSIVGALVIGQAAVQAGIVSAPMVIVVSLTGIANFTIPRYTFGLGIRMLRFPLMFLAGTFGLYGIVIGLLAIVIHAASLRSVGIPYMAPLSPLHLPALKDTFLRAPWWSMQRRPSSFGYQNPVRVPPGQEPKPPDVELPENESERGENA